MKSASDLFLTLFLCLLSLHLGHTTEFAVVIWLGCALSVLAFFRWVTVEPPTWGLTFVLLATGALGGSQILEDWALEGSWAEGNGFGAGLVLSLLLYLIWVFAARSTSRNDRVLDRETQTVLVLGLLLLLLIAPPDHSLMSLFGVRVAPFTVLGPLLATLALMANRCSGVLSSRVLLMLVPLLLMVPLTFAGLRLSQGPVLGGLANLFPAGGGEYSPTGFSPFQQLRPSSFVRPTNRAVMRLESESLPSPYLVGNRLVTLDDNLVWLAAEKPQVSLNVLDAEPLANGDYRYAVGTSPASRAPEPAQDGPDAVTIRYLGNESYLFLNPDTGFVSGRFSAMTKSAADVWLAAWERGTERRWSLEPDPNPGPQPADATQLLLPSFWDDDLQARSESFQAGSRAATAAAVLNHFQGRGYTLSTEFDPDRPFHDFFLNDKDAYCFWFATGATLALRANGIPTRLVGGYRVHEQLTDSLWVVRGRDAHSWVEWQDEAGHWQTMDPTPASIFGFFGGYQSSPASQWYHRLAGQWQGFIDWLSEDAFTANLVRYGGLAILVFLFGREYRRLRRKMQQTDTRAQRWQRLWERFLQVSRLPPVPAWTARVYSENLPADWPEERRQATRQFLARYDQLRFSAQEETSLQTLEAALADWQKSRKPRAG